jgi:Cu(I)/Ag(I) efflux system membrane fusion protein
MLASNRATEFGIRVEAVKSEPMARTLRAVAVIVPDESRVSEIHARVSGWLDQLYINKTGQTVRSGQALAAIFSPDLLAAQNELFAVKKGPLNNGTSPLLDGARSRLRVYGMTDAQIAALEAHGQPTRLVTIASPRQGVVIRRNVAVGTSIDPSTELMTVADLSKIWVLAEIPERDVPDVPQGTSAVLEFAAAGNARLNAKVAFVYPTLTERTRTLRVRFELDNQGERLKPGMYGNATFETGGRRSLTVPRDAVVDTGIEQHVFVVEKPEYYVPHRVEVGVELGDRVEIRSGLAENENVVASGVFLVDSESRLRASGGGAMAGMKMDSDGDKGQMPGMAMPAPSTTSPETAPKATPPASMMAPMPSMDVPPAATGAARPEGSTNVPPPRSAPRAPSGQSTRSQPPMPAMPGMDMSAPGQAPTAHAGHGE